MTTPTYFTVVADFKSVVVDLASDVDPDPQLGPVTAKVTFTPVLANGDVILATNATPRPTIFVPAPIVARIDTDGRLKLRVEPDGDRDNFANLAAFPATGNTAKVYFAIDTQTFYRWDSGSSQYIEDYPYAQVRLLADTPLLELASDLYYRVAFSEVVYNGAPGYISPFTFQAPTSDTELNLVEVARVPGQPASGITKIAPGAVRAEDGNLIFSFGGVDLAEPVPYTDVDVTLDAADISDGTPTGRALITAASAAAARTTLGATATGTSLLTATNALAARTAISAARAGKTIFVEDYRDGVRTDKQIIEAAFAALESGGEIRFGQGVTYSLSDYLDIFVSGKDNVLINGQGATLDGSANGVYALLRIQGSRFSSTGLTTLTAAVTSRTKTLTVASSAGWTVGDMIAIRSNSEVFDQSSGNTKQELGRIKAIPNGTTLTLEERTWNTYSITGSTVTLQRYRPVKQLTIRDLNMIGVRAVDPSDYATEQYGLWIRYFDGVSVENVKVNGTTMGGIVANEGIDCTVIDCRVDNNNKYPIQGGPGIYGREIHIFKVISCYIKDSRHAIDVDMARDVLYLGNTAEGTGASAFSTHDNSDVAKIINNTARECGGGIVVRGRNSIVKGNHILGSKAVADQEVAQTYRNGIFAGGGYPAEYGLGNAGIDLIIEDNYIDMSGPNWSPGTEESWQVSGIYVTAALVNSRINNNTVRGFPWHGIRCVGDYNTGLEISGNVIDCSSQLSGGLRCGIIVKPDHDTLAGDITTDLIVDRNVIRQGSVHSGIYVSGGHDSSNRSDRIRIRWNEIGACGTARINLQNGYYGSDTIVYGNNTNSVPYTPANWTVRPYVNGPKGDATVPFSAASILDTNGNVAVGFGANASAVNYVLMKGAATGFGAQLCTGGADASVDLWLLPKNSPNVYIYAPTGEAVKIGALGPDASHDINIVPRGSGVVKANGVQVLTTSGTSTVANKDLTSATNTFPTLNQNTTGTAANVTGTVAVANGGTGVTTLTGLVKASGTSAFTAAAAGTDYVSPTGAETVSGKTFISSSASTATAAGTTTLSISDAQVQIFTGSTTQTVRLPTTSVVAGQTWTVINNSSASVTVQSSGANALVILASGKYGTFTAAVDTPTTAANWKVSSPSDGLSVNSIAQRDSNGWVFANGFVPFRTSAATAAGTTTLTVASNQVQVFTGSSTQTVRLPTTGIYAGQQYTVINQSSGTVTVQSSGSNTISTLTGGTVAAVLFVALQDTPTTAAHWRAI